MGLVGGMWGKDGSCCHHMVVFSKRRRSQNRVRAVIQFIGHRCGIKIYLVVI